MKFGKDLRTNTVPAWAKHYVNYKMLKQTIKKIGGEESAAAIKEFKQVLPKELTRVNAFYMAKVMHFETSLASDKLAFQMLKELGEMQTYVWINNQAFLKIVKKFVKRTTAASADESEFSTAFLAALSDETFLSRQIDPLLQQAKYELKKGNSKQNVAEMKIMSGSANRELTEEIAGRLGIPVTVAPIQRFNDGEVRVEINEPVRGMNIFIVQPTCPPVNDNIMELFLCVSACKRASAASVTAVVPYYGYGREDLKPVPRVPIQAADVARMLEAMGVDRVICVDLHAGQIQGFFGPRTPVDNLYAGPIAMQYFSTLNLQNTVCVSPDASGVQRAKYFKELMEKGNKAAGLAICMSGELVGDVSGRDCIIVDDMVDSAKTLCTTAHLLHGKGAARIFAFCTHGLFSGSAAQLINDSPLDELIVSNSVPIKPEFRAACKKVKQLSVGRLLAEVMLSVHQGLSVEDILRPENAEHLSAGLGAAQ